MKTLEEYINHRIALKKADQENPVWQVETVQHGLRQEITELEHLRDMLKFYPNPKHEEYTGEVLTKIKELWFPKESAIEASNTSSDMIMDIKLGGL